MPGAVESPAAPVACGRTPHLVRRSHATSPGLRRRSPGCFAAALGRLFCLGVAVGMLQPPLLQDRVVVTVIAHQPALRLLTATLLSAGPRYWLSQPSSSCATG